VADENDDLLNPDEIEGLLNADAEGSSGAEPQPSGTEGEAARSAAEANADAPRADDAPPQTPSDPDDIRQPDVAEELLNRALAIEPEP